MENQFSRRRLLAGFALTSVVPSRLHRSGFSPIRGKAPPSYAAAPETGPPFADMHAHPARVREMPSAASLLSDMDARGITRTVLSPPPVAGGPDSPGAYGPADLSAVVRQAPTRLAFSAGGEVLNPMLQHTPANNVPPDRMQHFRAEAAAIARSGAAAFAELGAEVLPSGAKMQGGHNQQTSQADHPFLLELTVIAANFSMPIGLHMEAITTGAENISALERLLSHNVNARIVWLHAGWDRTGERTVTLMQTLLQRHLNLFMTIKSDRVGNTANAPLDESGTRLKPEWLTLLRAFPDRFVIGSDQFYDFRDRERLDMVRRVVNALPPDLAHRIGVENPPRIYRLTS